MLHAAIHGVSDNIDRFMLETHICKCEVLRTLHTIWKEHPDWSAKDINRQLRALRLNMVSRKEIATFLHVKIK